MCTIMSVSDKIIIDLTENLANKGVTTRFYGSYCLPKDLLLYPQSQLELVTIDFDVTVIDDEVDLIGEIICEVTGLCDKCLDEISKSITLQFEQTFYKDIAPEQDCYVYENSLLDATKAVCDEILLSMPTRFLCKEDCLGLCTKCGVNKNKQQCDCDCTRENAFSILKNIKF